MSSRANANAVLRDGGRGNTSRRIDAGHARPGRVPDRRDLRPADRIAAAGAVDPQSADDRLRLRHRRHPVGAHGTDGRRLSVARRAQAVLRPPAARAARQSGIRGGRAHQPLPHGVLRQRADRDRRQAVQGEYAIGRTRTSSRSPAGFFDVTGQKLLEGRHVHRRRPRCEAAGRDRQRRVRAQSTSAPTARSAAASARSCNNGTQPGPWRTIVGVVSTVRMLGPFNNPNVDDSGFYVPFYSIAAGPATPGPFVSQFATVVVKPRARPARRRRSSPRCGARSRRPIRTCRSTSSARRGVSSTSSSRRTASSPRCSRSSARVAIVLARSASTA